MSRATILVGGRRRDLGNYLDRIQKRIGELQAASKPKRKRELLPGEERQLMLPGIERQGG